MPVTVIPGGDLVDATALIAWIANELETTYQFTNVMDLGAADAHNYMLHRDIADTFHGDSHMSLGLTTLQSFQNETANLDLDDTGFSVSGGIQFNMSPDDISDTTLFDNIYAQASDSVTVDWRNDAGTNEITVTAGDFSSWVTADYNNSGVKGISGIVVSGAATAANNGFYSISTFNTTTSTNDTLVIKRISAGGNKDIDTLDLADTITVQAVRLWTGPTLSYNTGNSSPNFMNAPRSDTLWENCCMSHVSATAPYVSGLFITSPTAASASPSEPLNFILILETTTGVYRQMSFGEVVKLIPYTGGMYMSGSFWDEAQDVMAASSHAAWLQGPTTSSWNTSLSQNPGGFYAEDYHNGGVPSDGNGRGWMRLGAYGSASIDAPTHYNAAIIPHFRGTGCEFIAYSPSPFSGQSEGWPMTVFGTYNVNNYTSTPPEHSPMAIVPDIFLADITNIDAGSVFQNSAGDKFLVVPIYTKSGSGDGSSEKWGYLIRNPALTVT